MAIPSLFDNHSRESIRVRLLKLQPDSKAQWGNFDVNRMLAHCLDTLEVCFAERPVEVTGNFFWNSALGRWFVIDAPLPWPKGAPTAPDFFVTQPTEFARDRQRVLDYVERFAKGREQTFGVSPFLGTLNPEQWSRLHYRHLDHHLKQFGC